MKLMKEPGYKRTAPGRGLVPVTGLADKPYTEYLTDLDPKGASDRSAAVRHALSISSDIRFREFLARLSQPRYARMHLATIAKTCDIGLPEFADFWQKAQHMRSLATAQEGMTVVTQHMVSDAKTKKVSCDRCDGLGAVFADEMAVALKKARKIRVAAEDRQIRACPACQGLGEIERTGDTDSRRMLMDIAGLSQRRGPAVAVAINNYGGAGIESAVDKMSSVTFDIEPQQEDEA